MKKRPLVSGRFSLRARAPATAGRRADGMLMRHTSDAGRRRRRRNRTPEPDAAHTVKQPCKRPACLMIQAMDKLHDLNAAAPGPAPAPPQPGPGSAAAPQSPARPRGAYMVWVTNATGDLLGLPTKEQPCLQPNPGNPDAVDLYFGVLAAPDPPPKEQFALQLEIDKVLRACQRIYLEGAAPQPVKFRTYYTRLFRVAQLGLQGSQPMPEVAAIGLQSIASDLVDDEGATIKNAYLVRLGLYAGLYALAALLGYGVLKLMPAAGLNGVLARLGIDADLLACFMLLWVGCFAGVWLSYGIRKTKFSLMDLTSSDEDRLAPHIRLVFAGLLTMLIGMLFSLGLLELQLGAVSLTDITRSPLLAFIVGAFCGISELALPASIRNRATQLIDGID
jgi:hypothetical protein